MQSNNLKIAAGGTTTLQIPGTGFWFESGTSTTADTYIVVKPDTGAEFRLKPGQHVQDKSSGMVSVWRVSASDPGAVIDGKIIIGNGDFGDSNVSNTFKLDGTFTNTVSVNNTPANRVPVSLDTTQNLPVTVVGAVTVVGGTVNYTNAWADASGVNVTAQSIVTAAANVNGLYIEFAEMALVPSVGNQGCVATILAKASNPGGPTDGDVLFVGAAGCSSGTGVAPAVNVTLGQRIKVPAGKGLWLNQSGGSFQSAAKTILYTLL